MICNIWSKDGGAIWDKGRISEQGCKIGSYSALSASNDPHHKIHYVDPEGDVCEIAYYGAGWVPWKLS